MTRLRGASLDSPDKRSSASTERPQVSRSKCPPNAPSIVVQNTIEVSDPSRVLPWYRDDRRRRFNLLVRRYKNQLLYGCDDPGCLTPTCASRRRRISEGPYRRYTELSARTLACYLASLDDAEKGLCCNPSRNVPDESISNQRRASLLESRAAAAAAAERNASPQFETHGDIEAVTADTGGHSPSGDQPFASYATNVVPLLGRPSSSHHGQDLDNAAEQPMKDPKSFTQNLFDTLSLRMVEWLPLRRAADPPQPMQDPQVLELDRKPSTTESRACENANPGSCKQAQGQLSPSNPRGPSILQPRTPSSRTAGTQSSAVELKFQNQNVKRVSVTDVDQWRQASRTSIDEKKRPELQNRKLSMNSHLTSTELPSLPSPPALKHRPQKHRGRIAEAQKVRSKARSKNQRRVSWESEKMLKETYLGESPRTNRRNKPPSPSQDDHDSKIDENLGEDSLDRIFDAVPMAQTLTHLTPEIIGGLAQTMIESEEDAENWRDELDRIQSMGTFDNPDWRFATSQQRQAFPFISQSVFYVLSSASQILHSFGKETKGSTSASLGSKNSRLDVLNLRGSLSRLFTICPWDIALHSVWMALDKLFVPPEDFTSSKRASRRSSRSSTLASSTSAPPVVRRISESATDEHISDADAAYIATVALFALVSSVPEVDTQTWRGILRMRAAGAVASSSEMQRFPAEHAQQAVVVTDRLEHELGLRLVSRLVRALTARLAYHEISKARQIYNLDLPNHRRLSVVDRVMDNISEHYVRHESTSDRSATMTGPAPLIVEWLRTLFLREWDGNPEMARSTATGGAIQILGLMYKERHRLGLHVEDFHTPLLAERLDPLEMPIAWAGNLSNNRTLHLLSCSFLFPPSYLVIYFRALNYSAMSKYYEAAMTTTRHVTQTAFGNISITDDASLLARMKVSMSTYLVLVVRRDNVLTDALNQLWRREKRELMRPLKVQMGMDEGEEGLDHGGVQQEFFRVLMAEALDPTYGMFTMDGRHHVTWFHPCSLEPLYKFELLGLLVSIAIYNGLTLPINFPVAFYRKLLGLKVKHLDHIRDGWPELTHGLESLLSWEDGDVSDVFMRTYEFSFENFGRIETVDMQKIDRDAIWPLSTKVDSAPVEHARKWSDDANVAIPTPSSSVSGGISKCARVSVPLQSPTPPSDETSLVTNQNRHRFVKDYIFWLTDKSIRPQFEAFLRGFHTCLDRTALSIFTPEALKTVVEGLQEIDLKELESHARYEGGFGPDHRVIRDFWSVVQEYSPEKKAQLLEFVTASDRVPVNGISSIMFVIQKNGVGDLRLPTSLTCFGRLLLPEYSCKKALAEKLDKALENARGFGTA